MKLFSQSMHDEQPLDGKYAFAVPAAEGHVALSANINPHIDHLKAPALVGEALAFDRQFLHHRQSVASRCAKFARVFVIKIELV